MSCRRPTLTALALSSVLVSAAWADPDAGSTPEPTPASEDASLETEPGAATEAAQQATDAALRSVAPEPDGEAVSPGADGVEEAEPTYRVLGAWVDTAQDATVIVQQGTSFCAGVHVGGSKVLTAYHCVADGGLTRVTTRDGHEIRARLHTTRPRWDLAVLSTEAPVPTAAAEVGRVPPVGATAVVIGHPYGMPLPLGYFAGTLRWSVTEGVISAVGPLAMQLSAPLNPGNSGGGVFDEDGRLIGIVSRKVGQGIGFATHATHLQTLLEEPARKTVGGALEGFVSVGAGWGQADGPYLGVGLAVSLRDRWFLRGAVHGPLDGRWVVEDRGRVASSLMAYHTGLRQRLGHGPWAVELEAFGGVRASTLRIRQDEGPPSVDLRWSPEVGGSVDVGGVALEVGTGPVDGVWSGWWAVRFTMPSKLPF